MMQEPSGPTQAATAIVFVCDPNFLVPTVGAALSARRHTTDPAVRVIVYVTDLDEARLAVARERAAPQGIAIRAAHLPDLARIGAGELAPTHASIAMLGRLWLDELLEPEIARFLYLDGDVDITGSLDPLLAMAIPPGGFRGAPETPWLVEGERGRIGGWNRTYLKGLGGVRPVDYCNTGVLLVDRSGWGALSRAARAFLDSHPSECRWHDQSALNAVAGPNRRMLSPAWNYNSDFMAVMDPRRWGFEPAIWHFTGVPKPWQGTAFPWGDTFGRSYKLGSEFLAGAGFVPPMPAEEVVAANTRSREADRRRLNWRYPWRRVTRAIKLFRALAAGRAEARRTPPPGPAARPEPSAESVHRPRSAASGS
jgi:lipopolysaccharide biosynthesis glycosyltransferase